jgi:general stress protein 26
MSAINDLTNEHAIAKMREIAELVNTCMLCTKLSSVPFNTRPMSLSKVDDSGKFWFISSTESDKNMDIQQNDQVQLIFSDPSASRYMSVFGEADIFTDPKTIDEAWTPVAGTWFTNGKETPGLSVIIVHPAYAHYWDTKDSKMITLLKIAAAAIAGKPFDDGVEGSLTLKTK